jgi:hypothetical protein
VLSREVPYVRQSHHIIIPTLGVTNPKIHANHSSDEPALPITLERAGSELICMPDEMARERRASGAHGMCMSELPAHWLKSETIIISARGQSDYRLM